MVIKVMHGKIADNYQYSPAEIQEIWWRTASIKF